MSQRNDEISDADAKIGELADRLASTFAEPTVCYPLLLPDEEINSGTVDRVFDDLQRLGEIDAPKAGLP